MTLKTKLTIIGLIIAVIGGILVPVMMNKAPSKPSPIIIYQTIQGGGTNNISKTININN